MAVLQSSQIVSVAHRPGGGNGLGNNLTVKLAVSAEADFSFEPYLKRVKSCLDHRCLHEDEPQFLKTPSTLEAVTQFVAADLFQQPLPNAQWVSVEVSELDRFRCTVGPNDSNIKVSIQHRNLTVEIEGPLDPRSGEVVCRATVLQQIDQVFAQFPVMPGEPETEWGERLFITLKKQIPTLYAASVDLGRHRSIWLAHRP